MYRQGHKNIISVSKDGTLTTDDYKLSKEVMFQNENSYDSNFKEKIQLLYDDVKNTFISNLCEYVSYNPDLKPEDSLMVIALGTLGQDSISMQRIPILDFTHGLTQKDSWTYDRTLQQYIKGIVYRKYVSNLPDFVLSETIRYQHTDPAITNPLVKIDEKTMFKPVIPDKLMFKQSTGLNKRPYVLLHNIFRNDRLFMEKLNKELAKINPLFSVEVIEIKPTNETITVEGHSLILRFSYLKLVVKTTDYDRTRDTTVVRKQNDLTS